MSRLISVLGTMHVKDEEILSPGEFVTKVHDFLPTIILGPQTPIATRPWIVKMGGEIRVELNVVFILNPTDEQLTVQYNVRLFEGTSENTNDLDGQRSGEAVIAKDAVGTIEFSVTNTEEDDDDRADVRLVVINSKA